MVKLSVTPLTEQESNYIQSTLDVLSLEENRLQLLTSLLNECPELADAFSMVSGVNRQSSFLINMIKRGFNYVCYESFESLFEIFLRHPQYQITQTHLRLAFKQIILIQSQPQNPNKNKNKNNDSNHSNNHNSSNSDPISESESKNSDSEESQNTEFGVECWRKACHILDYISDQAYNRPSEQKLLKMRERVFRSMTEVDISNVLTCWKSIDESNELEVAQILANIISSSNQAIVAKFHEHKIDIFKQSVVILRMINKTLAQFHDLDMLMPFLKELGAMHMRINVSGKLLAQMKTIIIQTLTKALGFAFTDELKQSWSRVLTFIIGIMIEASRNACANNMSTLSSGLIVNEIDGSIEELTPDVIRICQATWRIVAKPSVIETAVDSFYKDVLSSKAEIRNLFSKSNMRSQANKLVRAIGGTIAMLDNLEALVPILEELGRRHVYYNVQPRYFKYIKRSWFKMLNDALALKYTSEVERSWHISWNWMTNIMKMSLEDALLLYIPPEPIAVQFKVLVQHLDRIECQNLSFYGDIWFACFTGHNSSQSQAFGNSSNISKDENLQQTSFGFVAKKLAPFGGVKILNRLDSVELYKLHGDKQLRHFANDDSWFLRSQFRGTFAQQFDLHAFPFDQHQLSFTFALSVDDNIACFDEDSLYVRLMPFKMSSMAGAEWRVYQPSIEIIEQSALMGGSSSGKRYTHVRVNIPIARKWRHHLYETLLPLLLIEVVPFCIYFTDFEPIIERMAVVVTVLLTLFAFRWTVAKNMPPTPYLTLCDHFFNTAYLGLLLHIVCSSLLNHISDADEQLFYNWFFAALTFLLFVVIHAVLYVIMRYYLGLYPTDESEDDRNYNAALAAVSRGVMIKSGTTRQSMRTSILSSMNMNDMNMDEEDSESEEAEANNNVKQRVNNKFFTGNSNSSTTGKSNAKKYQIQPES